MYVRVPTYLHADDPISHAGLTAAMLTRPEVLLVHDAQRGLARACVAAFETWDERTGKTLRTLHSTVGAPLVLVIGALEDTELMCAIEAGLRALVWRSDATGNALARAVVDAASGNGSLPPGAMNRLLKKVGRPPAGRASIRMRCGGLNHREKEVLGLLAQGMDTRQIAGRLSYSERTVTGILHDVTSRFNLRNRTHAVAFAMREGLI